MLENAITKIAEAAVAVRGLLLRKGTAATQVLLATVDARPLGVSTDSAAIGGGVGVRLLGITPELLELIAAGVINVDDPIYADADGKVTGGTPAVAGTYWEIGVARTAASGDGVPFKAECRLPVKVIVIAALTYAAPAAITATAPEAAAALTTDLTGVDTGTDMTAAQAAQIEADLLALRTASVANKASIDALIADVTAVRTKLLASGVDVAALGAALATPAEVVVLPAG